MLQWLSDSKVLIVTFLACRFVECPSISGLCVIIVNQPCGIKLCKKLPEEGGDSVLHLPGDGRADGEAEAEGDQVDVGAQLVPQSSHLSSPI